MMPCRLSQMFLWVHLKEQEAGKHNLQQPQMPTWPFISVPFPPEGSGELNAPLCYNDGLARMDTGSCGE